MNIRVRRKLQNVAVHVDFHLGSDLIHVFAFDTTGKYKNIFSICCCKKCRYNRYSRLLWLKFANLFFGRTISPIALSSLFVVCLPATKQLAEKGVDKCVKHLREDPNGLTPPPFGHCPFGGGVQTLAQMVWGTYRFRKHTTLQNGKKMARKKCPRVPG